ncbi:MAG: isochorismatase family cysteine hydrolase [Acidobacteriota bacterium]|jgi:nicotinamidase-related amidase
MAKTVEVPEYEIEQSLSVDPETTALVVVDMQHDFVDEDGALPIPDAPETVPRIRRLLDWAREKGLTVVYTQDTHDPGDPEFAIWGEHVLRGTHGWEILEEIAPEEGEPVFRKVRYDGFYDTGLDHELRLRGIDTLIICGTVANICVHYTAASAGLRWYRVIHPVDALSALTEFDMASALRQATFLFQAKLTTVDGLVKA